VTASQHMVRANGLRFRTMVDGPADGEMFILLHGFPEGAESWAKQVDALAKAGSLAVAPDLRGYGLSDAPEGVEKYAIGHLVEDVAGIIKAFGRSDAHVAGHDWGAIVAWFFAARHPQMTKTLTALSVAHPNALSALYFALLTLPLFAFGLGLIASDLGWHPRLPGRRRRNASGKPLLYR